MCKVEFIWRIFANPPGLVSINHNMDMVLVIREPRVARKSLEGI
jgi:hypothetical protein